MCDEFAVGTYQQCKPLIAHADLINHSPHFFEADFADQRSGAQAYLCQFDPNDCVG
jgi:hypothetical protein